MTDEQRYACEMLRTAMNAIHQQPHTGLADAFLSAIDTVAAEVEAFTGDDNDTAAQAWHRAAVATRAILRDHSETVKAEWIAAYSNLPVMMKME